MKNSKATGQDEINAELIKYADPLNYIRFLNLKIKCKIPIQGKQRKLFLSTSLLRKKEKMSDCRN